MKTVINYDMPIVFGSGWNCCNGKEAFVLVFDNGARWAACKACANQFSGSVYSLFLFDPNTFVFTYKWLDNSGFFRYWR